VFIRQRNIDSRGHRAGCHAAGQTRRHIEIVCLALIQAIADRQESPMFRFTIRDVLWLTALVALAVAWYLEHERQQARIDKLDQEVQQMVKSALERATMY
jgi:hypothetical protein